VRARRILALLLCASTLALAASGCGGDGGGTSYPGTQPKDWAATVCGAMSDWAAGLKADSQRLGSDLSGGTPLPTVKAKFVIFLQNAERSTGRLRARVEGAGPPAVKDGAAIQQRLVSGLERGRASFERAVKRAKKLSTTDRLAFMSGVGALAQETQKELTATGDEFNRLDERYHDKSLNEATSGESSCSNIGA
jgi:hypothetical protein